jgi:hypothetical protein
MTLDSINRYRRSLGRAAALFSMLFFLCALDGVISHFGQSPNELSLLPGASVKINGPARDSIRNIQELEYITTSDLLSISFEALHTGYWMGGRMWRGVLTVSPNAAPGAYTATVRSKAEPSEKPVTVFAIKVYGDAASLQKSSASIIHRYTGYSPWWAVVFCFASSGFLFGIVYLLSNKREQLLRQEGKADIYRISKKEDGDEVSFGLGTRDGIRIGSQLRLLDQDGIPVGTVVVREAFDDDAVAVLTPDCCVKPGYMVALLA